MDEGVDTGPIIIQEIIKIDNKDTEKTLTKKILVKEHEFIQKQWNFLLRRNYQSKEEELEF